MFSHELQPLTSGLKPFIFLAPFSSHLRPRCWTEGLRCVWLTGGTPGEGAMVTRGSQRRVTELSQLQASRSRQPHRNLKAFRFSTFNPPAHFSHLTSDAAGHCVTDRRRLGGATGARRAALMYESDFVQKWKKTRIQEIEMMTSPVAVILR